MQTKIDKCRHVHTFFKKILIITITYNIAIAVPFLCRYLCNLERMECHLMYSWYLKWGGKYI